jgi:hypothetical protein
LADVQSDSSWLHSQWRLRHSWKHHSCVWVLYSSAFEVSSRSSSHICHHLPAGNMQ